MLKKILKLLTLKELLVIGAIYLVITVALMAILISMPNKYQANGTYAPSEDMQSSSLGSLAGSLGGLASMAGLNLGGGNRDNLQLAIEVIKSKKFIYKLIEDNDLKVEVFASEKWDPISKKIIYKSKIYDSEKEAWIRKVELPKLPEPSLYEVYEVFKGALNVNFDGKKKIVKISYKHVSPVFAQKIVDLIVVSINDLIQQREIAEATTSIDLLRSAIDNTNYAEMRTLLYELVQEQTKKLLLAKTKNNYVLDPIDPPIVEENKHSPKRALILIVYSLLFGLFVLLYIFLKPEENDEK